MDSTLKPLKATLKAIRDLALNALAQIDRPQETRSMRWNAKTAGTLSVLRSPFHWRPAADAPDVKVRRLIRFFEAAARRVLISIIVITKER
jgi:hypothetical protein